MLVHSTVTPIIKFAGTNFIHLDGERHCESKVSCPRTQRNIPGQESNPDCSIRSRACVPHNGARGDIFYRIYPWDFMVNVLLIYHYLFCLFRRSDTRPLDRQRGLALEFRRILKKQATSNFTARKSFARSTM